MSFEKTSLPITFQTPADWGVASLSSSLVSHILVRYDNDRIVNVAKGDFAMANHSHATLAPYGAGQQLRLWPTLQVTLEASGWMTLDVNGGQLSFKDCGAVQTYPSGYGTNIYADGFVEWSMARLKDNITPLPPNIINKPLLPRQYVQNTKRRLGFIVEESPSEILASTINEEGVEETGIDLMALCAIQQGKIEDLEKRLTALEAKIK